MPLGHAVVLVHQGVAQLEDLVAQEGGFFELELDGRFFHLLFEVLDQPRELVLGQLGGGIDLVLALLFGHGAQGELGVEGVVAIGPIEVKA